MANKFSSRNLFRAPIQQSFSFLHYSPCAWTSFSQTFYRLSKNVPPFSRHFTLDDESLIIRHDTLIRPANYVGPYFRGYSIQRLIPCTVYMRIRVIMVFIDFAIEVAFCTAPRFFDRVVFAMVQR